MKPEIYEQDGVKRCRIKVSETETVDRIATDEDLLASEEAYGEANPPPAPPKPKGKKKYEDE